MPVLSMFKRRHTRYPVVGMAMAPTAVAGALPHWLPAFLVLTLAAWPDAAFAQATTLGSAICIIRSNLLNFPPLLSLIAICMGAWFLLTFGIKMREHVDNPTQNPLHSALWRLLAGFFLLAFPSAASWLVRTIFPATVGGAAAQCPVREAAAAAQNVSLDVMLQNMVADFANPMIFLVSVLCYVIGIYLVIKGLRRAANYGSDPRTNGMIPIVSTLGLGALLLALPTTLSGTLATIFGGGAVTFQALAYTADGFSADAVAKFNAVVAAVFQFIYVVGLLAFVRGWIVIRDKVEGTGQAGFSAGFTHIIGGAVAMNLAGFITILQNSLGIAILGVPAATP